MALTANIILPGRIATPRITFLDEQKANREGRAAEGRNGRKRRLDSLLGRYGKPEECDVVAFLASQCAAYLTGGVIRVDGGLIASI